MSILKRQSKKLWGVLALATVGLFVHQAGTQHEGADLGAEVGRPGGDAKPTAREPNPQSRLKVGPKDVASAAASPTATRAEVAGGRSLDLREAQSRLSEIRAELTSAQNDDEIARLKRNERVVGRVVERLRRLRREPPPGP